MWIPPARPVTARSGFSSSTTTGSSRKPTSIFGPPSVSTRPGKASGRRTRCCWRSPAVRNGRSKKWTSASRASPTSCRGSSSGRRRCTTRGGTKRRSRRPIAPSASPTPIEAPGTGAARRCSSSAAAARRCTRWRRSSFATQSSLLDRAVTTGGVEAGLRKALELTDDWRGRIEHSWRRASWRALLGDAEGAIDELERAVEHRRLNAVNFGADPVYDKIRSHPRFQKLLHEIGLDGYFDLVSRAR